MEVRGPRYSKPVCALWGMNCRPTCRDVALVSGWNSRTELHSVSVFVRVEVVIAVSMKRMWRRVHVYMTAHPRCL